MCRARTPSATRSGRQAIEFRARGNGWRSARPAALQMLVAGPWWTTLQEPINDSETQFERLCAAVARAALRDTETTTERAQRIRERDNPQGPKERAVAQVSKRQQLALPVRARARIAALDEETPDSSSGPRQKGRSAGRRRTLGAFTWHDARPAVLPSKSARHCDQRLAAVLPRTASTTESTASMTAPGSSLWML